MLHFFARRLKEMHEKDEKGQKGFTLIELLVVIIIIGILAAIAIPAYLAQRDRARESVVESDVRTAGTAISTCLSEVAASLCDSDGELDAYGFNPSGDANRAYTVTGGNVAVTSTHADNSAVTATFDSGTGQVT